jgi:hypothetical protein
VVRVAGIFLVETADGGGEFFVHAADYAGGVEPEAMP